jgi:glycosyltransferase involved in cell wall biosynthesis
MRITYLCNEYPPASHGGIGTFLHTMARAMADAGNDVTVAGIGNTSDERRSEGVRVITLARSHLHRGYGMVDRWRLYHWLRRDVPEQRTQMIETPEFEGFLAAPFSECPVVVRIHLSATAMAASAGRPAPASLRWYEHHLLRHHRNWIGVSRFALRLTEETFGLHPLRGRVIYLPVTLPESGPISPPPDYLLFAGTVTPRKGVYVLAEAARRVLTESLQTHLVFAGRIPDHSAVDTIRAIAGPDVAPRIHFTGPIERACLAAYMRRARAFVFPSTLETFGLVTAEAMLASTPVVVCDCGPNPEFIHSGENGLLVPPNKPGVLADTLLHLLRSPDLAAELAENGRRTVEREFSVDRCMLRSQEFYREVLAASGTRCIAN